MERDNYYIILELPFDPPEEDATLIENQIRKKSRYWSKYAEDPNLGMLCKKYLNLVPDMRAVMSNMGKRRMEAKDAARIAYAKIEKELSIVAKRGYLYKSEVRAVANKCKVEETAVQKVCTVKIVEDEKKGKERIEERKEGFHGKILLSMEEKPRFSDKYDQATPYLEALGKEDYYDFLNINGKMSRLRDMPAKRLLELTNNFFIRNAKHTVEESAMEKISMMCKDTFSSEEGKKDYDRYLLWQKIGEVMGRIQFAASYTMSLVEEQREEALRQLIAIQGNQEYCRTLLEEYCKVYHIACDRSGAVAGTTQQEVKPKRYDYNETVQNKLRMIKEYIVTKRFYAAQEELKKIVAIDDQFEDIMLESTIEDGLNRAKKCVRMAGSTRNEGQVVAACIEALDACIDYPGIQDILERFPVRPPSNFTVSCDTEHHCNRLQWNYLMTEVKILFYIIRKHTDRPTNLNDGELIATTASYSYVDETIIPGDIYYYAIFASRMGVNSSGNVYPIAVQNLYDVSEVECICSDHMVRIEWKSPLPNAQIEVYKQRNVIPERVATAKVNQTISSYGFIDYDVENETQYGYLIVVAYQYHSKMYYSKGKSLIAKPRSVLKEVEEIVIKSIRSKNRFIIEWKEPERGLIRFYYSDTVVAYAKGQMVKMSDVTMHLKPLQVNKNQPGKGIFTIEEGMFTIVGVTIRGEEGLIGEKTTVVNQEAMKVPGVTNSAGAIHILGEWPEGAESLLVLSRRDTYPTDMEDKEAQVLKVPKAMFDQTKTIKIEKLADKDYYFLIFAKYFIDGKYYYSLGTQTYYITSKKEIITYSTKIKGILAANRRLELTFTGERKDFSLPDLQIYIGNGFPPIYRSSGKLISQVGSRLVKGSYTHTIPLSEIPENAYVKVFIEHELEEQNYLLSLLYGSKSKIT